MSEEDEGPRWMDMPSISEADTEPVQPAAAYHDLGDLYPDAPVPAYRGDVIIHRAVLHDSSGVEQLFDWVASGDVVIVELKRLMRREVEFAATVSRLQNMIEGELGGGLVQVGDERLIILPHGFRGLRGVDEEVFSPTE